MPLQKPVKIILEYEARNAIAVAKYWAFINKRLNKRENVPARIILKLMSLFTSEAKRKQNKNMLLQPKFEKTFNRFNKYGYHFKRVVPKRTFPIRLKDMSISDILYQYGFEKMLWQILDKLTNEEGESLIKDNRDKFIANAYTLMNEYQNQNHMPEKLFPHYKRGVVAGYMAIQFGYTLTPEKDPANKRLFQYSRNAIKHLRKKKPRT